MNTVKHGVVGTQQPRAETKCDEAWLGGRYSTIRLSENVEAVRVHVGAGVAAASRQFLSAAGSVGRWYAVGDVILTRSAYTASRALPSGFSKVDWCILKAGSIVNVGQCSPMFGHAGGGEQVEFVSGPPPVRQTGTGDWSDQEGRA